MLCLLLPCSATASEFGKLIEQGSGSFNRVEKENEQWLKKEQAADKRQRELARQRALKRRQEARKNGSLYAPELVDDESTSGTNPGSGSESASSTSSPSSTKGVGSVKLGGAVSGTSAKAYIITCNSGRTWRIWRSSGQWWDGRGAQGGQNRDLEQQAEFLCR